MNGPGTDISVQLRGTIGDLEVDAAFDAPMNGITALFGPSGAGKTTLLRSIAGLERLAGRLVVGGEVWQSSDGEFRETHRRSIGYVFQEPSLFAHLSVHRNLVYGERRAHARGAPLRVKFEEVVELMGIGGLLERPTVDLSGGERQRVAIGRALLSQPRLLLMDEPLASLDRRNKEEILPYLERLHEDLQVPIIYVGHDLSEIERLADVMVLIERGRVLASGPLGEILTNTRLPIALGPDAGVVLDARIRSFDEAYNLTELGVGSQTVWVPGRAGSVHDTRRIHIAAADVSLARQRPSETSILNVLSGRVIHVDNVGNAQANVVVAIAGSEPEAKLLARISRRASDTLRLAADQPVFAQVKAVSLVASGASATLI